MSKEVYRSANGKPVDMGALRLKNERTRAVGNMKVNARGDEIDSRGRVIRKKTEQVNNQYQRQVKVNLPSSKRGDNDV
jgi:hypothetical protein